jgi:hypothetical protein
VCSVHQYLGWTNARVLITNMEVKEICEYGLKCVMTWRGFFFWPPVASYLPCVICKRRRNKKDNPHVT